MARRVRRCSSWVHPVSSDAPRSNASAASTTGMSSACPRRTPHGIDGATLLSLDLLDTEQCAAAFGAMAGVTHVIYAALSEAPGLVSGWRDRAQMQRNLTMLRNVLDPLCRSHVHSNTSRCCRAPRPTACTSSALRSCRSERWPRHPHENFYFLQEDHLRDAQRRTPGLRIHDLAPTGRLRRVLREPDEPDPCHRRVRRGAAQRGANRCRFPVGRPGSPRPSMPTCSRRSVEWATHSPCGARRDVQHHQRRRLLVA